MKTWTFDEMQLGAALEAWARTRRPNGDTALALKNVSEFLNSKAGDELRRDPKHPMTDRAAVAEEMARICEEKEKLCRAVRDARPDRHDAISSLHLDRALLAKDLATAIRAAAPLPAGMVCVPVEPTEAMHAAANREWDGRMSVRSAGVWQAMLAAAQKGE